MVLGLIERQNLGKIGGISSFFLLPLSFFFYLLQMRQYIRKCQIKVRYFYCNYFESLS